jgi:hypothetical protein
MLFIKPGFGSWPLAYACKSPAFPVCEPQTATAHHAGELVAGAKSQKKRSKAPQRQKCSIAAFYRISWGKARTIPLQSEQAGIPRVARDSSKIGAKKPCGHNLWPFHHKKSLLREGI